MKANAVGAGRSAVAVHAVSRRWLSFLRWAHDHNIKRNRNRVMKLYHCLVVIYACVLVSESLLADQPPQVIANDARLAKLIREGTTTEWNGIGKWSDANRKPVLITECVTNEDGDFDCGFDIPVDPTQGGALILFTTIPDDDIAYYPLINDQGMHFYSDGQRGLAAIRFTPSESLKRKNRGFNWPQRQNQCLQRHCAIIIYRSATSSIHKTI